MTAPPGFRPQNGRFFWKTLQRDPMTAPYRWCAVSFRFPEKIKSHKFFIESIFYVRRFSHCAILRKQPSAAAHILYRVRCRPAKNCFRFLRIRPKSGKVSIPAWANHIGQLHLVCCLKCMNQFQNRDTVSRAEINCLYTSMVYGIVQRLQVSYRQINSMEIIPLAGAVRRGIVAAENRQFLQLSRRHATDVGHQIVGNTVEIVSQQAGFVSANGVKYRSRIAQKSG